MNADFFWSFCFVHLPYADVDIFIPALLFIGFSVGVVSAFLGIGGGWLVTPALNILGLPMAYAIGTDIAHVGAKGMLATFFHARRNHVDFSLAFCMVIGTALGIEGGAKIVMLLEKTQNLEMILRWVYIVILFFISITLFLERKNQGLRFHEKILRFSIPPVIYFKVSNIRCSIWIPMAIGLISGFVAGFLGIGGGLLRLPMLLYFMGCPTLVAIGTDLFEVMLSGFYGGFSYALKGRVDFLAAILMFLGAASGTKFGVLAAERSSDQKIKSRFGIGVVGCLISIVLKILNYSLLSQITLFSTMFLLVFSILKILWTQKKQPSSNSI